jgi:ribosomal protein L24
MKQKLTKICAVLLFCLAFAGLHAQEAIPASGGNASGSGGTVSYTFGQVYYITVEGVNGTVAQGVQQPYEISVVTGTEKVNKLNADYTAYPNPAGGYVMLIVKNYKTDNMTYQLYDNSGKIIENSDIKSNETRIDLSSLIVAPYFLKVSLDGKEIRTFKIVKY